MEDQTKSVEVTTTQAVDGSWRGWCQRNHTVVILTALLVLSFSVTITVMAVNTRLAPERQMDVKWLEGFCGGMLSSLGVSLNTTKRE